MVEVRLKKYLCASRGVPRLPRDESSYHQSLQIMTLVQSVVSPRLDSQS